MDAIRFRVPIRLHVGGKPIEIDTLQGAVDFLREWPGARRGPVYTCAMKGCDAALVGSMKVEHARKAFESFARITGILENRSYAPDPVVTLRTTPSAATMHR
ncbi:DUF982 domain-containing protein [Mesorhizobium sp. LHD-90]|uniref:DUF982 domain-containing protein n=1 Tax=Mesorhizobium sp. LHD-90 TaxID=3071414 RepID=UPI0027DFD2EB|nr:DUF982 domain-containing protein [Mesorhizobium sp. LHD-90]MDQ6436562.1 DUF982 domain-containing protein [Mesorhizobium sp. LHD-90]